MIVSMEPQTGRKYLQKIYLVNNTYQNIKITLKTQQENKLIKKWAKDLTKHLTEEDIHIANK